MYQDELDACMVGSEVSPQRPCAKGLVASGRAFVKWLDHEDSHLIHGLIHWWVLTWMDYWEVAETQDVGPSGRK
jgi:hypothetical protein